MSFLGFGAPPPTDLTYGGYPQESARGSGSSAYPTFAAPQQQASSLMPQQYMNQTTGINFMPDAEKNIKYLNPSYTYTGPNGTQAFRDLAHKNERYNLNPKAWTGTFSEAPGNTVQDIFGGAKSLSGDTQTEYKSPANLSELRKQMDVIGMDQLVKLDSSGQYQAQFADAAQQYANNFQNAEYAKRYNFQDESLIGKHKDDPLKWSQGLASNWLQSSYGTLMNRLNAGYLL
jgi:hypothetical protein